MRNMKFHGRVTALLAALILAFISTPSFTQDAAKRLDQSALGLSDAQKTQIDQIIKRYITEQQRLNKQYPVQRDAAPNAEAVAARKQAREHLNAELDQVLTASQRQMQDARRAAFAPAAIGPAGPGGPRTPVAPPADVKNRKPK